MASSSVLSSAGSVGALLRGRIYQAPKLVVPQLTPSIFRTGLYWLGGSAIVSLAVFTAGGFVCFRLLGKRL